MVLDFGLLNSGLFDTSEAVGEGFGTGTGQISANQGMKAEQYYDATEYSTTGNDGVLTFIDKTLTLESSDMMILGIMIQAQMKTTHASTAAQINVYLDDYGYGAQIQVGGTSYTAIKYMLLHNHANMMISSDGSHSLKVKLASTAGGGNGWDVYVKETYVTVYLFDGVMVKTSSYKIA